MGISAVLTTLIGIAGTKYIAWELGAEGVGVQSLFTNAIGFLTGLFGFSLANSGTQYIAKYAGTLNDTVNDVIKTVIYLSRWQAMIAFLLVLLFSYVFELNRYTDLLGPWTGVWMATGAACSILLAGYQAQINGFRWIKSLAILNTTMTFCGVAVTCFLVYYFGLRGLSSLLVAPYAFGLLICLLIVSQKRQQVSPGRTSLSHIRKILGIGWVLTIGVIAVQTTQLVLRSWLERHEGIVVVGYFHASWLIGMTYISFILSAMIAEYYPRLSALSDSKSRLNQAVNGQISVCLIMTLPMIILGFVFSGQIVTLLYTVDFEPSSELLRYLLIGDLFKVVAWAMAIGLLVRECKIQYVLAELIWNTLFLLVAISLYEKFELVAIGTAYIAAYVVYYFWTFYALKKSSGFELTKAVQTRLIGSLLALLLLACVFQAISHSMTTPMSLPLPLPIAILIVVVVLGYSAAGLRSVYRQADNES